MYIIACLDNFFFHNPRSPTYSFNFQTSITTLQTLIHRRVSSHSLMAITKRCTTNLFKRWNDVLSPRCLVWCSGVNKSTCGSENAAAVGQLVREPVPVQPRPHAGAAATTHHTTTCILQHRTPCPTRGNWNTAENVRF